MTTIKSVKKWAGVAIVVTIIVLTLWGVLGFYASTKSDPGEFGDSFGAATSLFSGLAFAGIIITIWIQSQELELQRNELELTRKELSGQRENLAEQNRILQRQNYVNTYFQMLRFFTEISRSMTHPGWDATPGVEYWRRMTKELSRTEGFQNAQNDPNTVRQIYDGFFKVNEPSLGHYFSSLTELLTLLDAGDPQDQASFSRLLRAQLSTNELRMIYYHGFGVVGAERLKPHIEKYGLLKFLPLNSGGNVRHYYAAPAYGEFSTAILGGELDRTTLA